MAGNNIEFLLSNASAYNNTQYGFRLYRIANTTVIDSSATDNNLVDVAIDAIYDFQCGIAISNMTGSGGRPINYSNSSVTWSGLEASEIILCNADDSYLDNIIINGSDDYDNNLMYVLRSDRVSLTNSIIDDNYYGARIVYSSRINFTNVTFSRNAAYGIYMDQTNYSIFTNNNAYENGIGGFYLISGNVLGAYSHNNSFVNNTAHSNSGSGFYLTSAATTPANLTTNLTDNTAYGNLGYGVYIFRVHGTNIWNTTVYNNAYDMVFNTTSTTSAVYMYNTIFRNPLVILENYTNLSTTMRVRATTR
jgi:parallel beta-helix repeat protein